MDGGACLGTSPGTRRRHLCYPDHHCRVHCPDHRVTRLLVVEGPETGTVATPTRCHTDRAASGNSSRYPSDHWRRDIAIRRDCVARNRFASGRSTRTAATARGRRHPAIRNPQHGRLCRVGRRAGADARRGFGEPDRSCRNRPRRHLAQHRHYCRAHYTPMCHRHFNQPPLGPLPWCW